MSKVTTACIVDNSPMMSASQPLQWDIFCKVIDNFGDIGVCWRLGCNLAQRGGNKVRLWVDDASALNWMAADRDPNLAIEVLPWNAESMAGCAARVQKQPCDVLIEAFGCEVAIEMIAACAGIHWAGGTFYSQKEPFLLPEWPVWINLEYLTAEPYTARCHGLPSPVQQGPGKGQSKFFYYPGFTAATGGLLREPGLMAQQATFDVQAWRCQQVFPHEVDNSATSVWISLFCYEPTALPEFLQQLAINGFAGLSVRLLVASGRASQAVQAVMNSWQKKAPFRHEIGLQPNEHLHGLLSISYLPLLTQHGYDRLLWACDFNAVRGEDSLVRAIWAGKPLLWQAYPQDDGAEAAKVRALMDALDMPPTLRQLHRLWNTENAQIEYASSTSQKLPLPVEESVWVAWQASAQVARTRLLNQPDLATQLIALAKAKSKASNHYKSGR